MAPGFPEPSRQARFPAVPADARARLLSPSSPSISAPPEPSAAQPRTGVVRSLAPWCGLAAVGVAALLFIKQWPDADAASSAVPNALQSPRHRLAPLVAPAAGRQRAPSHANAAASPETEPQPFASNDPPSVPEPYTGDPEGQALWEQVVEDDQRTLQPDDLIEDPAPPRLDLTKLPAYQAERIDADGNLN